MNKQALTEALAYVDSRSGAANSNEVDTIIAAARLVERLLPGECEWCHGDGQLVRGNFNKGGEFYPCPHCQNGRVWDEGIVEAAAKALEDAAWDHVLGQTATYTQGRMPFTYWNMMARAVLSALVELLTEKVK